ncbi:MAG TPA: hypothetical protein VGJ38_08975, partial [Jatrophihabitantaceae bacterium]
MRRTRAYKWTAAAAATIGLAAFAVAVTGSPSGATPALPLSHYAFAAPDDAFVPAGQVANGDVACQRPVPSEQNVSTILHCPTPQQMRQAYGIDQLAQQGEGQTIVLVDSFGSPTAANDLAFFAQTFDLGTPDFEQVFPNGKPGFEN